MNFLIKITTYLKIMLYICSQYDLPRFPLEQRTRGGLRVLIHC